MTRVERICALRDEYEDLEESYAFEANRHEREHIAADMADVIERLHELDFQYSGQGGCATTA